MTSGDTAWVIWEGWTTKERLNEVRGKLKLKEFDRRVSYEWTEDERRRNEEAIIGLRKDVRSRRLELKGSNANYDWKVINNVFQNRREERLSLQRLTAKEAVTEMDQKVCEKANFLNALRYARVTAEEKLRHLGCMSSTVEKTAEQLENEQRIRNLENSLDKARMKCDMGRNISHQYEFIVKKMKEESLYYPGKLDMMENEIMVQRGQLQEMRKMLKVARNAQADSREELTKLEQHCHATRRQRDQVLAATRKEVERRKRAWDEKSSPASSKRVKAVDAGLGESNVCSRLEAEKLAVRCRRLRYDDIFEGIKDATYLTSLNNFIDRIGQQEEVSRKLTAKTLDLRKSIDLAKEERRNLQDERSNQSYAVDRRISRSRIAMDQLLDNIHQQRKRKESYQEELRLSGSLITDVKTVILSLMDKLKAVKLKPEVRKYSQGDVMADLDNCHAKMTLLVEGVDQSLEMMDLDEIIKLENHETSLSQVADSIKIKLSTSVPSMSADSYQYDSHDINEETLSRDDIKRMAQAVVCSQTKTKSKKPKNKNKRK